MERHAFQAGVVRRSGEAARSDIPMSDGPTYRGGEDKVAVPISGTEAPVVPEILDKIERMGVLARSEVSQSKQTFALRDIALAEDLVRQDEQINQLNRDIFRRAVDVGTDPDTREWAMTMMLVARAGADRRQRVDVGEQVAFVVSGLFRKFSDASHPAAP